MTCAQYVEFLNAVAATDPYGLYSTEMSSYRCDITRWWSSGSCAYSVSPDHANRPVNFVSWYDAARFCNWLTTGETESGVYTFADATTVTNILDHEMAVATLGKTAWFIPTVLEWYKAAYHKNDGVTANYFDYPTGSDTVPSNDVMDPDQGNNANFYAYPPGYTVGKPYYTTEVGEFENSQSPYGTFDQGGNLYEWNEVLMGDLSRARRGGGWNSDPCQLGASCRYFQRATLEYADVGLRVASIPESAAPILGDLDGDGIVGSHDLDLVRCWWLRTVEAGNGVMGDANGDGFVDSADLDIVRGDWGAGTAAVPEPGVMFLLLGGAAVLAWRGRRHA